MTINHRVEAERLLASADTSIAAALEATLPLADQQHAAVLTGIITNRALGHAMLARDEEQAARTSDMRDALRLLRGREYDVRKVVSAHIAKALTSRDADRWKAGRELAQALDTADCNMDDAVDAHLSDDGWDPRSAWKAPASAVRSDDPWAATPDVTAEVPEPVRRVIAGHLAEALLDGRDSNVQKWARGIAYELKNVGADLTDEIKQRITDMTLGGDPTDPPF
ncbi:hypothetical protein [Streptomyces sp. enrichment culture]|uniref:hypothetical protein n=1 Tax=Streptomyces sp. enrichment culture TaxID=1795815 RepID=UPI003F554655